jgi:hypothetical protein
MKLDQLIREEIDRLLNEYVVPVSYSLSDWKKYREKYGIENADYHKKHPKTRWKVVHGHSKGEIGKSLPGMSDMSYQEATKAHAAIAMRKETKILGEQTPDSFLTDPIKTSPTTTTQQKATVKTQFSKPQTTQTSAVERGILMDIQARLTQLADSPSVDLLKAKPILQRMLTDLDKMFKDKLQSPPTM